jgi:hypothetical protein
MADQNVSVPWTARGYSLGPGNSAVACAGSWYGLTMDPEAARKARIAVLQREIDLIHRANELYWRQEKPSDAAKADYYRRQVRLDEIRDELAELQEA